MPHAPHHPFNCPNCGFRVERNYCAECGQPAHLHKETFVGLLTHFVAHYFHYEGRFLSTVRTLIFRPGALTLAYWQKQRMRYIPPISLYIFVSFVFFFTDYCLGALYTQLGWETAASTVVPAEDKLEVAGMPLMDKTIYLLFESETAGGELFSMLDTVGAKLFLLFLPVMAFLLTAFFHRRKDLFFGDHAVFSLHFNTMFFIIWLIVLVVPEAYGGYSTILCLFLTWLYLTAAIRNAYGIRVGWSIVASLAIYIGFLLQIDRKSVV